MTESLAIAEEFICFNYLWEKGYVNECNIIIKERLDYLCYISAKIISIYKMLLLFDKIGSISKESYIFYYGNDFGYEYNLKMLKSFDYNNYFINYTRYVLATTLAPYLYCKYKDDNSFMKTLINLHGSINNKDIMSCFKEMGLTNLNNKEVEQIIECVDNIMSDINNVKTL